MRFFSIFVVAVPVFVACGGKTEQAPIASPVASSPTASATTTAMTPPAVEVTANAHPAACPTVWHGLAPMLVDQSPCPPHYSAWKTQGGSPQNMCALECASNGDCCGGPGFACTGGVCKMR